MEEMIFKQMIEDSPVPYFYAKIIRNELGECIGLKMEKVNNSFKKFFNVQDVKNMSSFHKFNGDENNLIVRINNNNESEVKKLTRTSYVKEVNLYCKIVFYQFASNYLYVNIIGTDSDKAQLPKSMRQGPIISWIKDLEGRYLDVSQTFRDYRGQEYIDIIGKTDYELIKSESAKQYILEDKEVIRTNKVQRYKEYYGVGKKYTLL
ncbi:MAG: PAS domain-containing protein [Peptostreptococcaceae bacterium]